MTDPRSEKRKQKKKLELEALGSGELAGGRLGGDVHFSSDGKRLIETGLNGEVRIWCVDTGQIVRDYTRLREAQATGAAESKRYREQLPRVISDDAQRVATLRCRASRSSPHNVYHAWFSADGRQIVTSSWRSVRSVEQVWDAASGEYTGELLRNPNGASAPPSEPERLSVVSNYVDKSIDIRDAVTGQRILTLTDQAASVRAASYSPTRELIVTVNGDMTAAVWDAASSEQIAVLKGHGSGISAAKFSPDGGRIVTASWDKTAAVWDTATGERIVEFVGHAEGLRAASFSPDGRWVVMASGDKTAAVWEVATGKRIALLAGHAGAVSAASFSPDGQRIVTVSTDKTTLVWDAATGRRLSALTKHTNHTQGASWLVEGSPVRGSPIVIGTPTRNHKPDPTRALISPDSRWLFYRDRLHDIHGPGRSTVPLPLAPNDGTVRFSPQPGRIAMLGSAGAVVWDYGDPDRLFVGASRYRGGGKARIAAAIPVSDDGHVFGAFSTDARFVVTFAIGDSFARLWDTLTGDLRMQFDAGDRTSFVALSVDGSRLAAIDRQGRLTLWNCTSGANLMEAGGACNGAHQRNTVATESWAGHAVRVAEFSPDGRSLAVGAADGTVVLIDALTGSVRHVVEGPSATIDKLKFVADGDMLLSVFSPTPDAHREHASGARGIVIRSDLRAINVEAGKVSYEVAGRLLAISPDSSKLVVARDRDTLIVSSLSGAPDWSVPTAMTVATFSGTRLLLARNDGSGVQDFDTFSGMPMGPFGPPNRASHSLNSIGRQVIIGFAGRGLTIAAADTGDALAWYWYKHLAVCSESSAIVLITDSGELLHVAEGRPAKIPFDESAAVSSLSVAADGSALLVGLKSGKARLIRLSSGFEDVQLRSLSYTPAPVPSGTFAGFDSAGELLLTYDDSISVWDIAAQRRVLNAGFGDIKVTSASFSFDASQIVALCSDGVVRIVRRDSGKIHAEIRAQDATIVSIQQGPADRTLAAICSDETLRIFDAGTGELLAAEHTGPIDALTCISPDSNEQLAVVCGGSIRRWLFTKVGRPAEGGAGLFRFDGHPLKSKADVAAFLEIPMVVLNRALKGDSSEPRYRSYDIPKRTGGKRRIDAPTGVLRSIQQKLNPLLQSIYDAHPSAHGFVADRSIVTNAAPHAGKRWVLNVDLADFFPSIGLPAIRTLFRNAPFSMAQEAAQTVAELCTYRHGLPQGAPTSPVLSNLAAAKLDMRLERLARKFRLTYSRYADDITLSTNAMVFPPGIAAITMTSAGERLAEAGAELSKAIEGCGFRIKPSKTRLQHASRRQEVTGLGVNEKVNVARKRIRRLRAMLHAWEKYGLEAAAWEHFQKYSPRGTGLPPRHFVPTRYWRRDSKSGSWTKQTESEQRWPQFDWRRPDWKEKRYGSFYLGGGSARRIVPASFRRIVIGNLAYLHMVRGADDPVLAKLCLALAKLDPKVPQFVAAVVRSQATDPGETDDTKTAESITRACDIGAEPTDQVSAAPTRQIVRKPPEPEMVLIPAGRLTDRTARSHAADVASERADAVVVESFALAPFAVTFADWDVCVDPEDGTTNTGLDLAPPSDRGWGRGARPVINVSWYDAQLYIAWLNRIVGLTGRPDAYRLPTEAEWEYACRAGTSTHYHQGETITTEAANFDGRATGDAADVDEYRRQTVPVGTFAPNTWGLHEMHGNVWEWCEATPMQASTSIALRTLRGGSWSNGAIKLQAGNRWQAHADYRAANIGFRLARSISDP